MEVKVCVNIYRRGSHKFQGNDFTSKRKKDFGHTNNMNLGK